VFNDKYLIVNIMIFKRSLVVALIVWLTIQIQAQTAENGIIQGRVYNSKNNTPISYATVVIWGTTMGALSDSAGVVIIKGIKPGYVQLKVSSVGYNVYTSEPILITNSKKVFIDIPMEETQVSLAEVTIRASPFRKSEESPVSLRRIDIAEIERNPGSNRDISKVIQSFPGVSSTPAYRNDVIVRGGGAAENRFYLDGVEIPNINHFATQGSSGGPVGIINVDFIKEVNFYSGAFPASRGNALSSVLEFNQIDGNKDKLKFKGAIGASDLALTLDGPLDKKTTFIASARRSYLQFLFEGLGLPFLPTYNDFQFKTRTSLNEKNEISFIGLGALDQNKLNLKANETESQRFILGYLPVNEQWSYTVGGVFKHFHKNGYDTWVLSRNHLNNVQYKYLNNVEIDSLKTLDYSSYEIENKFRYERSLRNSNGYKINVGVNLEYAEYYNRTFQKLFNGTLVDYKSNLDFIKWGMFGQVSKTYLKDRLILSLGLRSDANNYSSQMDNLFDQISPRFSISYALSPQWTLDANAGRYYQLPPYTTLGLRNSSGELLNKQNKITYVSADHLVTGFEYQPNQLSKLSVEVFYKWYKNYPLSVNDSISISSKSVDFGTFGDEQVISAAKGKAYGVELLYQNKDLAGFNVILSYTLVRSMAASYAGKFIPTAWDNKHILNLTTIRNFKRNWNMGLKWRFVGGAPYTPWDINKSSLASAWDVQGRAFPDYSQFNQLRLRSFHQLDFRVDKNYFFNKWSLRFYIDVQNVYGFKADEPDQLVRQVGSNGELLPATGTPSRYSLKVLESEGGGTILPTVGVIVEF
jgi:hypothetical protein